MAGLRVWASGARHETAAAHVEEALLTRFRELERAKAGRSSASIQSPKRAWWKTPGYVGLAASVLLLLGLGADSIHSGTGSGSGSTSARAEALWHFQPEKAAAPVKVTPEPSSEPVRKPVRPARTRPAAGLDSGGRGANSVCGRSFQAERRAPSRSGKHCQ